MTPSWCGGCRLLNLLRRPLLQRSPAAAAALTATNPLLAPSACWLRDATALPKTTLWARSLHAPSRATRVTRPSPEGSEQTTDKPTESARPEHAVKTIKPVESTADATAQPSLWQRFKQMYKEYWYVLIPVHVVTSAVWFGGFYYAARSGIDIVPLLESLGASEKITKPLKDSGAGYIAIAYAMYKIATPARYMVTLGGTTFSISYLRQWGIIKPAPSPTQLRSLIRAKRAAYQEKRRLRKASKLQKKRELHRPFKRPEG